MQETLFGLRAGLLLAVVVILLLLAANFQSIRLAFAIIACAAAASNRSESNPHRAAP